MKRAGRLSWALATAIFCFSLLFVHSLAECPSNYFSLADNTTIVISPGHGSSFMTTASEMLIEEVGKRTQLLWLAVGRPPFPPGPRIVLSQSPALHQAEAYRLRVVNSTLITIDGADNRGVFFGVGRLLREMQLGWTQNFTAGLNRFACVPRGLDLSSAPEKPLRMHMISFTELSNSVSGWSVPQLEQYIRDLIVFGTNGIEVVAYDGRSSPNYLMSPIRAAEQISRLCSLYDLHVSIWWPSNAVQFDPQYTTFQRMKKLDMVFVPGGDPGSLTPTQLFTLLNQLSTVVQRYHPTATLWVSNQGFTSAQMSEFYALLSTPQANCLHGIVYGPHARDTLATTIAQVPRRYPVRLYPDLGHGLKAMYPNPLWPVVYAATEGREMSPPKPRGSEIIARLQLQGTIGFGGYSEGCIDDVNKIVWSSIAWNSSTDHETIVSEYSRYFLGAQYQNTFTTGLLELEKNWIGRVKQNPSVEAAFGFLSALEHSSPQLLANWRYLIALVRAYFDKYQLERLIYEENLTDSALQVLGTYGKIGSIQALEGSAAILGSIQRIPPDYVDLYIRIRELSAQLFSAIRLESSTTAYFAIGSGRGAYLDSITEPLTNRLWLVQQYATLRNATEVDRVSGIVAILEWKDPGPGGFYDNLGVLGEEPHLVRGVGWEKDPSFFATALDSMWEDFLVVQGQVPVLPYSWYTYAETLYDFPLQMQYSTLQPNATYQLKVVYTGEPGMVKLEADGIVVHDYLKKTFPPKPLVFAVPKQATADGKLTLTWSGPPGVGGSGRGCQVGEVWLQVAT